MDYHIDYGEIQDPTAKFEKGRIAVLAQERIHIQKKTFTKWCNSFLEKVKLCVWFLECGSLLAYSCTHAHTHVRTHTYAQTHTQLLECIYSCMYLG